MPRSALGALSCCALYFATLGATPTQAQRCVIQGPSQRLQLTVHAGGEEFQVKTWSRAWRGAAQGRHVDFRVSGYLRFTGRASLDDLILVLRRPQTLWGFAQVQSTDEVELASPRVAGATLQGEAHLGPRHSGPRIRVGRRAVACRALQMISSNMHQAYRVGYRSAAGSDSNGRREPRAYTTKAMDSAVTEHWLQGQRDAGSATLLEGRLVRARGTTLTLREHAARRAHAWTVTFDGERAPDVFEIARSGDWAKVALRAGAASVQGWVPSDDIEALGPYGPGRGYLAGRTARTRRIRSPTVVYGIVRLDAPVFAVRGDERSVWARVASRDRVTVRVVGEWASISNEWLTSSAPVWVRREDVLVRWITVNGSSFELVGGVDDNQMYRVHSLREDTALARRGVRHGDIIRHIDDILRPILLPNTLWILRDGDFVGLPRR